MHTTRAPRIFGAILMFAGGALYFVDMSGTGRNPHWFLFPALILMGLGALFAMFGPRQVEG